MFLGEQVVRDPNSRQLCSTKSSTSQAIKTAPTSSMTRYTPMARVKFSGNRASVPEALILT